MSNNDQSLVVKERQTKLSDFLVSKQGEFKKVMTGNTDRFMRMVQNVIIRDPKVAEASMQSVYLEVQKAAADGLMLDGREATLTRFNTNKKYKNDQGKWVDNWQVEVVYIPMVAGIMKRVRNSGEIKAWSCELVYKNEYDTGRFKYTAAPDPVIYHEPIIVGERGPVVAAYSAVKLRDGTYHYEIMTIDQLVKIKNRTKSKDRDGNVTGPWKTDEEEMYRKTVIRRHSKRLPVSSELLDVTRRVDDLYDFDAETMDAEVQSEAAKPKPKSAASTLRQLTKAPAEEKPKEPAKAKPKAEPKKEKEQAPAKEEPHDEETGEMQGQDDDPRDYEPDDVEEVPDEDRRDDSKFNNEDEF